MKKTNKLNKNGFSLVELIIVIAIMAVLIGVLAPQYIKYLDKSKVSADKQLADNVKQAITTVYIDPTIANPVDASGVSTLASSYTNLDATATSSSAGFWGEVYSILGVTNYAALQKELKLDPAANIKYLVTATGKVQVKIDGTKYTGNNKVEIE